MRLYLALRILAAASVLALGSCASRPPRFRPVQLAPNQAVIYVYRPRALLSPGPVEVYIDQTEAGKLSKNRYLCAIVGPGEHLVRVQRRSEVVRLVRIGPGETAYLEAGAALLGGSVSLASPDESIARERIAVARLSPAPAAARPDKPRE
ncbi:MAG: hypothetical protein IPJ41_04790 [Phycisphaerales bacterium]|nr:hypothetical protein [Phycisphaerales bacterium]